MASRSQPLRRDDQPAFVLHTYAYRESSLIVEAFTSEYGRVAMVVFPSETLRLVQISRQ